MGVSSQSQPGCFMPQGNSSWYPLNGRLDGPQSHCGCLGEVKNLPLLLGIKPWSYSHLAC